MAGAVSAIGVIELCATFLWAYALVLATSWLRSVAAEDPGGHVGHFVSLMAVLVPVSSGVVLLVFMGSFLGLPSVVAILALVVPAGLAASLQLEVSRLRQSGWQSELRRLGLAGALAGAWLAWRAL